jgi:penicillin-insensitive murein endopeptidase
LVRLLAQSLLVLIAGLSPLRAQDLGTMDMKPLPPLEHPDDPKTPAKELFGRAPGAAPGPARVFGYYTHGCFAGGQQLPINGPQWQVMRLSRNRNWGHPNLIRFIERLAARVPSIGWHGLLVGDMAQPRGGPMITGHWSHQVGLDADIWLTPMPDRELSREERETMMATNIVADDWHDIDPKVWSPTYIALLKTAAQDPEVERVLVNPAIKKALCRDVTGDRSWLRKMRPVLGHNYHTHIRISCPKDSPECKPQPPPPSEVDCAAKDLDYWFKPKPRELLVQHGVSKPLLMSALPPVCKKILNE